MDNHQATPISFFQFRLRSLFILMTGVALLVWLVTLLSTESISVFLFPAVPIMALTAGILGIVYLSGGRRAFSLGFTIGLVFVLLLGLIIVFVQMRFFYSWETFFIVPFYTLAVPSGCGFIGLWFHSIAQRGLPPIARSMATPAD